MTSISDIILGLTMAKVLSNSQAKFDPTASSALPFIPLPNMDAQLKVSTMCLIWFPVFSKHEEYERKQCDSL